MNGKVISRLVGLALVMTCFAVAGCPTENVVGEDYDLAERHFHFDHINTQLTWDYDATEPYGQVISQNPGAGTWVMPFFSTVFLTVSNGSGSVFNPGTDPGTDPGTNPGTQNVSVPTVTGLTQSAANEAITQAGLTAGTVTQVFSETVAADVVISQDPAAGTSVSSGSAVALTISKGPTPTSATVPNVVGQTQTAASAAITDLALPSPAVLQQCSATVPAGTVIAQNPAAGTVVGITSVVAISVSSGTCTGGVEVALMPVAAGTFTMGNSGVGDDLTSGSADESPAHQVTLSAYQIGKYEVTNEQFCAVLNWANAQGYLKNSSGAAWAGTGDPYFNGNSLQQIISLTFTNIQFTGGTFNCKTVTGQPGQTTYTTESKPVVAVSWYGAVAFCNWLSQMQGLTPCYDLTAANWPLVVAPPSVGGYRLPTEAEWERAAAWDGAKHWIYGFTGDTLTSLSQANYNSGNPFGLSAEPYTSPVGWFDGVNVNPNGGLTTAKSVSPVGAYDMTGNASEWCTDFYLDTYYSGGAMTNPTGPQTAQSYRVAKGGSYGSAFDIYRTASRSGRAPAESGKGFRLVRP